jgi:sodium/bile acid cotransporter 7
MNKKRMIFWLLQLCLVVLVSQAAAGGQSLTDEEKKKTVYKLYQEYKNEDFPYVEDISPLQAMFLMRSGEIVFVDTREEDEMKVSMLPGAITQQAFLEEIDRYEGKTIVAYCTISFRSGLFAKELAARGVAILNLRGGILAWALEGGGVCDDEGETRRIHVYGSKWNYVPSGYEAVKFGFFESLLR